MIFVFGDSFARFFTLIKDSVVKVYAFKGATLKGLTKPDSKNRKEIESILSRSINVNYVIFVFGQVDLNLSFYYDAAKQQSAGAPLFASHYASYIKTYVDWITNLHGKFKRIILGAYPSPLNQHFTLNSLVHYGSLTLEEVESNRQLLERHSADLPRKARYFEFIYTLKANCNALKSANYKFHHSNTEYFDLNKYLLDENLDVREPYLDISQFNMHIRWEPIIPLLIKEMNALGINVSDADIVDNIGEIESEYLKRKAKAIQEKKYLDRFDVQM